MRVMVIMKATEASEDMEMPSEQLLSDMTAYNEELVAAGIIQGGEGLHPSSAGKRLHFADNEVTITDGLPDSVDCTVMNGGGTPVTDFDGPVSFGDFSMTY